MPVVSVTRLRIRRWNFLPGFAWQTLRIAMQAKRAPGNLAMHLLRDRKKTFWTLTLWESERAMREFMLARPHGPAMRNLLNWCDEAALVHWTQEDSQLPTWAEAHRRLLAEGRPSKVHYPSSAHTAHAVEPPG